MTRCHTNLTLSRSRRRGRRPRSRIYSGQALLPLTQQRAIQFERDGALLTDEQDLREALAEYVDTAPQRLSQLKLARVS
jgi:hypothetical protein